MTKVFTLSDGIQIEQTERKSNRSGYTGAALSPSWTLDADKPFIAACSNPSDPDIMKQMRAQDRTAWHGGSYADAREAAYVVGLFRRDPVGTDRLIGQYGVIDEFPKDLYDLPPGLEYEKAVEILNNRKIKKKSTTVVKLDPSVPARGNLYSFFKREQIVALARAAGGPEAFQASLEGLTIRDFATKFDLTLA